ncbi:GLPGLI family protein [Mucilaginibacter mali]|uniref:GLPGLI family protein n=1 Tax=Mucilaginibacter mali TaxID=2740462 RepID=A0A7D4UJJ6_9SPHI|nr:GLPGLI family protein [Mucilaginibacter mali]QKJ29242.1 GLPGLI family protein [Mucilaginibacter mali]
MKKPLLLFTIAMMAGYVVRAQEADSAKAIVKYKFSHVRDTLNRDKPYTENMILFIGQKASAYKSYDKKIQDALVKKQVQEQVAAAAGGPVNINIKRNGGATTQGEIYQFPLENKMVRKENLMITKYRIEEAMPMIKWKISADTMSFGTLHCQKATGHFKGRDYTAWFCPDLPFHAGPWKLCGLPGLIVEAYDTNKEVEFKFDGMEAVTKSDKPAQVAQATPAAAAGVTVVRLGGMDDDTVDPNIIAIPADAVKTTPKQYDDLRAAMLKDPQAFMNSMMAGSNMGGGMQMGGGRVVTTGTPTMRVNMSGGGPVINNPLELPEKK